MPSPQIQTGLWTDWARGPIYGPSVTLTTTSSNVLIAIASLWVGDLVAGWVWACIAPMIYFFRNKHCRDTTKRDGIHVQHQLVWRNTGDPVGAALENFAIYRERSRNIARSKRKWETLWSKAFKPSSAAGQPASGSKIKQSSNVATNAVFPRIHRRTCLAFLTPFVVFAGFFIAGVFVSYIANSHHDVLVASDLHSCGLWNFSTKSHPHSTPNEVQNAYVSKVLNDTLAARTYARSCYSEDVQGVNSVSCSFFTKRFLAYSKAQHIRACPFEFYPGQSFEDGACDTAKNNATFVMYTDLLDSSIDFGINAHQSNSVQMRKTVNCSVLSLTNRTGTTKGYETQANTTYTTYLFGSVANGFKANVTAYVDVAASQSNNQPFSVMAVYANAGVTSQDWTPSKPFALSDGDVSLFFLTSNSVVYEKRIHDPWFLATDPYSEPVGLPQATTYFQPVNPISVMGCVDQYTICNKQAGRCTKPGGISSLPFQIDQLNLNTHQHVTTQRILEMLKNTDTYTSVYGTGSAALKASDTVLGILSSGLPSNQWEIEAEGWFQISLAKMQAYAVEYARNSERLKPYGILHFPAANQTTRPIWHSQCFAQRIANPGQYQVFSFLGLMLLLVLGIFFLIAAQLVARFTSKTSGAEYAADDKFELQRMALDSEMLSKGAEFPVYKPLSGPLPQAEFDQDGLAMYAAPPIVAAPPLSTTAQQPPMPSGQTANVATQNSGPPVQAPTPSIPLSSPATGLLPQANINQGSNTTHQGSAVVSQPATQAIAPAVPGLAQAGSSTP